MGAGGGANEVAFAPDAPRFTAGDISQDNLGGCVRQVITGLERTCGGAGVTYQRNLASTTTFTIEVFWCPAARSGLIPRLLTSPPADH